MFRPELEKSVKSESRVPEETVEARLEVDPRLPMPSDMRADPRVHTNVQELPEPPPDKGGLLPNEPSPPLAQGGRPVYYLI